MSYLGIVRHCLKNYLCATKVVLQHALQLVASKLPRMVKPQQEVKALMFSFILFSSSADDNNLNSDRRLCRIVTNDFPQNFAIISRVRQETNTIGTSGGMLSSTVVPQVQAVFPEGTLTKKIKVGLQVSTPFPRLAPALPCPTPVTHPSN